MKFLADFENLHINTKSYGIGLFGLIPFYFISIYLFKNELIQRIENPFNDIDFYFVLCLCFCLSLSWYSLNFIIVSVAITNFETTFKVESNKMTKTVASITTYIGASLISLLLLPISILANYIFGGSFKCFIIASFSILILYFLILLYNGKRIKKRQQKLQNT